MYNKSFIFIGLIIKSFYREFTKIQGAKKFFFFQKYINMKITNIIDDIVYKYLTFKLL